MLLPNIWLVQPLGARHEGIWPVMCLASKPGREAWRQAGRTDRKDGKGRNGAWRQAGGKYRKDGKGRKGGWRQAGRKDRGKGRKGVQVEGPHHHI